MAAPAPRLDALLRGDGGGAFDTAGFVSEALDALSLEQLRAWLLSRLEATRSEVRRAPPLRSRVLSARTTHRARTRRASRTP